MAQEFSRVERDLGRHEVNVVRTLSGPALYVFYRLSKVILQRGLRETVYSRKAKKAFKSSVKESRKKFGQWSTQSKSAAVTEFLCPGVKGLIHLVGFERFIALNEQQRRQLLTSVSTKDGLMIATEVYACIRSHIDFGGIWQDQQKTTPSQQNIVTTNNWFLWKGVSRSSAGRSMQSLLWTTISALHCHLGGNLSTNS